VLAYGVVSFGADEQAARTIFEFAKAMGIPVITADPAPESFAYLARLCQEYRIRVAIHNHGPNTRYDTIRTVEDAMRGQPDWIGACIDTAHFLRSGEDPVAAARRFGKRVHAVHLKDVKDRTRYTLLGEGDLDLVGFLRVLRRMGFTGCLALEYEEKPDDPLPDLQRVPAGDSGRATEGLRAHSSNSARRWLMRAFTRLRHWSTSRSFGYSLLARSMQRRASV
jgi:inosose dehydratase